MGTCWRGARPIRPSAVTMTVLYYLPSCLCQVERKPRADRARGFKTTEPATTFDEHYMALPQDVRGRLTQPWTYARTPPTAGPYPCAGPPRRAQSTQRGFRS